MWNGDRQSTQERVQSNDQKDDSRTQEKNGYTEQEVFSRVRKYEEQPEFKNAITEMKKKNALEEIKSGINEQEEWISKMEDIVVEITDAEKNKQKGIKKKKKYMNLRRAGSKPKCLKAHLFGYVQIHWFI